MDCKLKLDYLKKTNSLFLAYPEGVIDCGIDYSPASKVFDALIKALPWRTNLSLGNKIFLPSFENSDTEKQNKDVLSKYGKVYPIASQELAVFGGLLHCISFTN